jgi:hypothetical protein
MLRTYNCPDIILEHVLCMDEILVVIERGDLYGINQWYALAQTQQHKIIQQQTSIPVTHGLHPHTIALFIQRMLFRLVATYSYRSPSYIMLLRRLLYIHRQQWKLSEQQEKQQYKDEKEEKVKEKEKQSEEQVYESLIWRLMKEVTGDVTYLHELLQIIPALQTVHNVDMDIDTVVCQDMDVSCDLDQRPTLCGSIPAPPPLSTRISIPSQYIDHMTSIFLHYCRESQTTAIYYLYRRYQGFVWNWKHRLQTAKKVTTTGRNGTERNGHIT